MAQATLGTNTWQYQQFCQFLNMFLFALLFLSNGFVHAKKGVCVDCGERENKHAYAENENILSSLEEIDLFKKCTYNKPHCGVWINPSGNYLQRLSVYNKALAVVRERLAKNVTFGESWNFTAKVKVVPGEKETFVDLASNHGVLNLFFEWRNESFRSSYDDTFKSGENLLTDEYYKIYAEREFCQEMTQQDSYLKYHTVAVEGFCNSDFEATKYSSTLNPVALHARPLYKPLFWPNRGTRFPYYYYNSPPPFVTYLQILKESLVNNEGELIFNNVKIVPAGCHPNFNANVPNHKLVPVYDEVFVIAQFWSDSKYYHKLIESIPRLTQFIQFLSNNEHIVIHVGEKDGFTASMLRLLGLKNKLIVGYAKARIAYLPQNSPCGYPRLHHVQMLSSLIRNKMEEITSAEEQKQRSILLIKRSGKRTFSNPTKIEEGLRNLAAENFLQFEIFDDQRIPPLETTFKKFHRAVLIVGPHGAGLSNIVASRPRTAVVEGVCRTMCYQMLAYQLGLRHYTVAAENKHGCESLLHIQSEKVVKAAAMSLQGIA